MARPKIKRKGVNWKELLGEEKDLMKAAVQEIVEEVLEAEMDELIGARKGERTSEQTGYRTGYYSRGLVTRVGKLELRDRRTEQVDSAPRCSSCTSAARRRWCRAWQRCMSRGCRHER